MKLNTSRIRLMPIEPAHYWQVYNWQHSGEYQEFFGNIPLLSFEQIAALRENRTIFIIVDANDLKANLGMIIMSNFEERHRNVHYNVLIDNKYQRLGIAKEATKLALYYIFNNLNMYKVIVRIESGNEASKAMAEDFGCELEGTLKHEIYHDGEFKDVLRYYITKGPFNKSFKKEVELSQMAQHKSQQTRVA